MMRSIALALCNWLVRRFDFSLIDEARLLMGKDAVARGERWEQFYREDGGIADMIEALRREAFEAAAELDPSETDKIAYWGMSDRNLRRLAQRVENIIATGKLEADRLAAVERTNAARIRR